MVPIDHTVYPDQSSPPDVLDTIEAKVDYVHRVCAAWDFHVPPEQATFVLFAQWQDVFDAFPILTSPAYHAFRSWFGWRPLPVPFHVTPPVPLHAILDRAEGRDADPCEEWM